jgi:enediyne biosynthesis protein E4
LLSFFQISNFKIKFSALNKLYIVASFLPIFLFSCKISDKDNSQQDQIFTRLTAQETGIDFINKLEDSKDFDVFRYRNYYNGGGVAIGDINNDGLPDVYLTSNIGKNKLYLNQGNFKFKDITDGAGVAGNKPWSTGVAMADINGDGWLDIYVCNSGNIDGKDMENELFINNGDGTFTERAVEFGLDDSGFSTHAVFFDYDGDGDLDCYILNNSFRPISTLGYRNFRNHRDEKGGDKLMRNDNGKFVDVSEQAGIYGSVIGFGLGISVGDVNNDNLPDIFISNDFYERDYLYVNQGDGTFKEMLTEAMPHISMFSMGADLADLNNDGYPEVFTTDMLPEDDYRLKTLTSFETYDVHELRLKNDYYYQFMRNTLQLNNGDGKFTEIGYLANVAATDWSWGALAADFTNNRNKEIFVCNGIYKDVIDQDFVEYLGNDENMRAAIEGKEIDFQNFVNKMPSTKISNYLFTRENQYQYQNRSKEWGLAEPSFSNGAAYGDLDGDGFLDLIVNNVNQELFIYKNNSKRLTKNNFVGLRFEGTGKNPFGVGAKVNLYIDSEIITYENMPMRGFQSSMDYKMILGLGESTKFDSLIITWPDGKKEKIIELEINKEHLIKYKNAKEFPAAKTAHISLLLKAENLNGLNFLHKENEYNQFDKERLIYKMTTSQGPGLAVADITGNGLDDVYIGGARGQRGAIYIQSLNGQFEEIQVVDFEQDASSEDVDAIWVDVNNDGLKDLFVVSGSHEFAPFSPELKDRLYINLGKGKDGKPQFRRKTDALPEVFNIGSVVRAADINNDGFIDLFVGNRSLSQQFGKPADQQILINNGEGKFEDKTLEIAPELKRCGMVTDAAWFDVNEDGKLDLLLVGDWMPVTVFYFDGNKFKKQLLQVENIQSTGGWWTSIKVADINGDEKPDLILGNTGLNCRLRVSQELPFSLYVHDFDNNGTIEQIHAYAKGGKDYPLHTRHDMIKQMPVLKKKFLYFKDYADKSVDQVFDLQVLEKALVLKSHIGESSIFINKGKGNFEWNALPLEAQFSTVFGIEVADINGDGHQDILLGGNLYEVKPELGRYDGLSGLVLLGDGKGGFKAIKNDLSGFDVPGETRRIQRINLKGGKGFIVARNNESLKLFKN